MKLRPPKRSRAEPGRARSRLGAGIPGPSEDARRIALFAAQAGLDKKALHVDIIDVTGKVDYADYLVLMTGTSDRHVSTIAQSVDEQLARRGIDAISIEGLPTANWVLIDFVDVVVHVFQEETRLLYDLDGLWMDARRIPVPDANETS